MGNGAYFLCSAYIVMHVANLRRRLRSSDVSLPAQFCFFKGIRHCFHSAREVRKDCYNHSDLGSHAWLPIQFMHACMQIAATFGIPLVRTEVVKRKREDTDDEGPSSEPRGGNGYPDSMGGMGRMGGGGGGGMNGMLMPKSEGAKKKIQQREALKKGGRMGSRFQNQKLVKLINVSCELRPRGNRAGRDRVTHVRQTCMLLSWTGVLASLTQVISFCVPSVCSVPCRHGGGLRQPEGAPGLLQSWRDDLRAP